jgi:bifunctional DNA-binding transcriptional regulator/antitoxin component of YhaV-PrlF toxin-antitoxin module
MAESKVYTVQVEEDENGDLVLPFPEKMLEELGWEIGDQLVWKDNGDGTYTITKDDIDLGDVVYGDGC